MEDAPLIVRKTIMGEKCASCNQITSHQVFPTKESYQVNTTNNNNMYEDINNKPKIRLIQDNSYKYGTPSYSRLLANNDKITEEFKTTRQNNAFANNSFQIPVTLPDINKISKKKAVSTPKNNKKSEVNSNVNTFAGEYDKNYIMEELEKKIINPENLIKASIKFAENMEKTKN